jgi:hypothetical protein
MLVEAQSARSDGQGRARAVAWRDALILLGLITLAVSSLGQLRMLDRYSLPRSASDLAQVWVGVRAAIAGRDPYAADSTRAIQRIYYGHELAVSDTRTSQRFAYPAQTAVVLAPLALVSWPAAQLLYLCTVPLLLAATVPLWLELLKIAATRKQLALLILLLLLSWPVVWGIRLEQLTLLVVVFLATGCWLLRSGQQIVAGIVFSLATIKPQVALPLLGWLLLWAMLRRRMAFFVSFFAATAVLVAAAGLIQPCWFSRWLAALQDYSHYTMMTPLLVSLFGRWLGSALLVFLVGVSTWQLWRLRNVEQETGGFGAACGLALAATATLLPPMSGMMYNQVLLLPGLLLLWHAGAGGSIFRSVRGLVFFCVIFELMSVPLAMLGEVLLGPGTIWLTLPFWDLVLPTVTTLGLCIYLRQLESPRALAT